MSEHSRWEMSPKRIFLKYFCKIKFTFQTLQTDIFWSLSWPFSCDYSFWLRDLKFGMCIKDPINKACWKNGQTRLLNLNFETIPKKHIFRFLAKISAGHGWSWKFFFCNFQILGPLGCQGWVVIPRNVKKSQNHCILLYSTVFSEKVWAFLKYTGFDGWEVYFLDERFCIRKPLSDIVFLITADDYRPQTKDISCEQYSPWYKCGFGVWGRWEGVFYNLEGDTNFKDWVVNQTVLYLV